MRPGRFVEGYRKGESPGCVVSRCFRRFVVSRREELMSGAVGSPVHNRALQFLCGNGKKERRDAPANAETDKRDLQQ